MLDADDDDNDDDDSLDDFFGADGGGGESSGGDDRGGGGGGCDGDGDVIDVDSLLRDDLAGLDLNGSNGGGRPPLPPGRSDGGGGGGGGDGGGDGSGGVGGSRGRVVGVLPVAVQLLLDLAFTAMAAGGAGSGVVCEVLLLPALRLMRWPTSDPAVCRGPMAGPHCYMCPSYISILTTENPKVTPPFRPPDCLLIAHRCTLVC